MMKTTDASRSPRQKLVQPFVLSEKVPKGTPPPPKLPIHPNMRPSSQQWVNEVKYMANQVDAMVRDNKQTRHHDTQRRLQLVREQEAGERAVDAEVTARLQQTGKELKGILATLNPLEKELGLLLQTREKSSAKLESIEKPLRNVQRRIDARSKAIPVTENFHDNVERTLHQAGTNMRDAAGNLSALITKAEGLVAHMNNLRLSLHASMNDKQQFSTVNEKCFAKEYVGEETFAVLATQKSRGTEGVTLPPLPQGSARKNPRVPKGDTTWAINTAKTAMGESAALRAQLATTSKAVDRVIAASADNMEVALTQKIRDTSSLRSVLDNKISALRTELNEVIAQQSALEAENETYVAPLDIALKKNSGRRQAAPLREVKGFDPIKDATSDEIRGLRGGHVEYRRQMGRLDQQRAKLEALLHQLENARDVKNDMANLDMNVLQIGHTPAPPSQRSGRSANGGGGGGGVQPYGRAGMRPSSRDSARSNSSHRSVSSSRRR